MCSRERKRLIKMQNRCTVGSQTSSLNETGKKLRTMDDQFSVHVKFFSREALPHCSLEFLKTVDVEKSDLFASNVDGGKATTVPGARRQGRSLFAAGQTTICKSRSSKGDFGGDRRSHRETSRE